MGDPPKIPHYKRRKTFTIIQCIYNRKDKFNKIVHAAIMNSQAAMKTGNLYLNEKN